VSEGGSWVVSLRRGPASELHGLEVPDPATRSVWILTPERPALVLGSTQGDDVVDAEAVAARGVDVVRRGSGGGAVLLDPGGTIGAPTLWIDVVLPRGDPLWLDDVGRSMSWLGDAWVRALATFGVHGEVHRGPLERSPASTLVCFAGVGPGEVVVGARKVVGISQRRTRAGARFQCLVNLAAAPRGRTTAGIEAVLGLLREPSDEDERVALVARLDERTATVAVAADSVARALVEALPTA
jgi:lipoate-protein ligase A